MNAWDKISHYYDNLMGERGNDIRYNFYDPIIYNILGNIRGKTILDAGCGNGYWTRYLGKRGVKEAIGVDFSEEMIRICLSKKYIHSVSYLKADLTKKLPFKPQTFELIICNLVLDYVDALNVTSKELTRILKTNGCLILGVQHPFYHLAHKFLDNKGNKIYLKNPGYFDDKYTQKKTFDNIVLRLKNRTVGDYTNSFIDAGLSLTEIIEPSYPEIIIKTHSEYKKKKFFPRFLIMKFKKVKNISKN